MAAAEPMADMLWRRALDDNDRATPERRARFETDLLARVAAIADPVVRRHYGDDMRERLARLFRGERTAARPTGGGRRADWRRPREAWLDRGPVSAELKALAGAGRAPVAERRIRLILLCVINHPQLLDRLAGDIAELEIAAPALDSLRRRIIDTAALDEGVDSVRLRDHLCSAGLADLIGDLERQAGRLSTWFAMPDAAPEDVATGLSQMVELHRKSVTLERELKVAEHALAEAPTEENLSHLNEIREQLLSTSGYEAQIEGFGEASGRASGLVT